MTATRNASKLVMPAPALAFDALQAKFATARAELSAGLIERDDEVDLALTALIAREHLLMVGPPGTAKSLLCDSLIRWLHGNRFSVLLTKFTTPEEVFGPISLSGLKADRYQRVTRGRLPEAELAFIDELWKASSAILNTLLKLLNEGTFENDGSVIKCPLRLCVAASNEWPNNDTGKELGALLDRFVFRKTVRPIVTQAGLDRLLDFDGTRGGGVVELSGSITPDEIDAAADAARAIPWSDAAKDCLRTILRELAKEGVMPGDRRKFKAVGAARAYAYLSGADEVRDEHLEVLQHVLWDSPEEQPNMTAKVISRIANPTGMRVNQLLLECEQILADVDPRNLASGASATAKLGEIDKQFGALPAGNPKVVAGRAYLRDRIKAIRMAAIDSI